jgi:hypothetical protein
MDPQHYAARVSYRPPAAWYRRLNRSIGVLLTALGLAPHDAVVLEVRGRRSGKRRRTPVLVTPFQGERYVLSLAGRSAWVRNVREAGGRAAIIRRHRTPVLMTEVAEADRPSVIFAYLQHGERRSGQKAAARQRRSYFGFDHDPTIEELGAIAEYYPVFQIHDRPEAEGVPV